MRASFTYRSLDELRTDIASRGLEVDVRDDLAVLSERVRIGERTTANRLAVHPMEGCDGEASGAPGELTFRRWRRFAEGGAALVWGEATAVVPEARANPRQLVISPHTAPALRRLLDETRRARRERFGTDRGFVVGIQLTHSGRWSHAEPIAAHQGAAIEAVRASGRVLSDAELESLEDRFVEAALLAEAIGFDFVDIKQCHTYLLNELLAARGRPGWYGGDFAGRTRFVRNVFAKVRAGSRGGLMLATRMNLYDGVPHCADAEGVGVAVVPALPYRDAWGVSADEPEREDLTEPLALIGELRALGLALINVTAGSPYYNPHIGRPFDRPPVDGYRPPEHPLVGVARHLRLAAAVQHAYPDLPVIGTGYSWLRHFALNAGSAAVGRGDVTLVGLGRGALAYPDFAVDALERGGMQRDRSCIGVSYCTALMRARHNDLGQYATGCVPRDPLYAREFREAQRAAGGARPLDRPGGAREAYS